MNRENQESEKKANIDDSEIVDTWVAADDAKEDSEDSINAQDAR